MLGAPSPATSIHFNTYFHKTDRTIGSSSSIQTTLTTTIGNISIPTSSGTTSNTSSSSSSSNTGPIRSTGGASFGGGRRATTKILLLTDACIRPGPGGGQHGPVRRTCMLGCNSFVYVEARSDGVAHYPFTYICVPCMSTRKCRNEQEQEGLGPSNNRGRGIEEMTSKIACQRKWSNGCASSIESKRDSGL